MNPASGAATQICSCNLIGGFSICPLEFKVASKTGLMSLAGIFGIFLIIGCKA